jgi:hypothetical protein
MINIICIKWGSILYNEKHVNALYEKVKKYTTLPFKFYCFTEFPQGIDENIIIFPLPTFSVDIKGWTYRKEAGLCDDNLADLNGERVFFFDLDITITGNLDELFNYPKDEQLYIIEDWYHKKHNVGQASCYTWVVGTLGYIKRDYEKEHIKYFKKFGTGAQEYLSYKIIEKYKKLNFFPAKWFISFKHDCLPVWYLRYFVTPKFKGKETCKVLVFHGTPKIEDAIKGIYKEKNGHHPIFFKKVLYKHFKACKWLEEYL